MQNRISRTVIDNSELSPLRKMSPEQRRTLARNGAAMTAETYNQNPIDLLPDLAELFEVELKLK